MGGFFEARSRLDGLRQRRDGLRDELEQVRARAQATGDVNGGLAERASNLERAVKRANEEIVDAEEQVRKGLRELTSKPGAFEAGAVFDYAAVPGRLEARDDAMRTLERQYEQSGMTRVAAERLEAVIESPHDPAGVGAPYLAAVGSEQYRSAFAKILASPQTAHLRMSREEQQAVERVNQVELQRSLLVADGPSGGFAVPFQLDPSVMLTSDGALNPVRQVARVEQIVGNEWRGVSSAGVTASYDAEASEASDDSPSFAQPTIATHRGSAFVPYSIEIGQDWTNLQGELTGMLADARDVLDSQKFLDGNTATEPEGVLIGATATVTTASTATFAVGDVWTLRAALPPRYVANASVLASPAIFDKAFRFVGGGSTEPPVMLDRAGPIVGLRALEWPSMTSATTSASKVMLLGDFSRYVIVDRIGMTVELIPHLFGNNRRPTGQRGLFAYWRTGAKVVNSNAFRVLTVR